MALKVLVAGTTASIHTGRFVLLLQEIGYDVRVFNCSVDYAEDEHIRNTHLYVSRPRVSPNNNTLEEWPQPPSMLTVLRMAWHLIFRFSEKAFERFYLWLAQNDRLATASFCKVVSDWNPDLVISLKMQNEGYIVARARKIAGDRFPRWLHFSWGTDIAHFGLDPIERPQHLARIQKVLERCDFHIADCDRDVRLAREFGLKGESLGSCLATGGFDQGQLSDIRARYPGPRRNIVIKGRHWPPIGVGMNIVQALADLTDELEGWRIRFMMCTPDVEEAVKALAAQGAPFVILPRMPYHDLLAEFAQARFTISATNVDGTPLFLAETMALGSVPIHSDLESVREWVRAGENGLLFSAPDVEGLKQAIRTALRDNLFIEAAGRANERIAAERMNRDIIRERVRSLIEQRIMAAPIERRSRERSAV